MPPRSAQHGLHIGPNIIFCGQSVWIGHCFATRRAGWDCGCLGVDYGGASCGDGGGLWLFQHARFKTRVGVRARLVVGDGLIRGTGGNNIFVISHARFMSE